MFPGIVYIYEVGSQKFRFVNEKIKDFLGYTREEISAWEDDLGNLVFKDDVEVVRKAFEEYASLQQSVNETSFECRFNRKQGDWRYFRTHGKVLHRDEQGKPVSFLMISQDITEQLLSEEEFRKARELALETERMLQYGIFEWDFKRENGSWSPGLYELLEYPAEQRQPSPGYRQYQKHLHAPERRQLDLMVKEALEKRSEFEYEHQVLTEQNQERTVITMGKVIVNEEDDPVKIIGNTRDVTRIREYEKTLKKNLQELNRSNKELEEFAYVASHDLQDPLRKIIIFTERIQAKAGHLLNEEGVMYFSRIMNSASTMRRLIDDLLEFSRVSRRNTEFEPTDLNVVLKSIKNDLELKMEDTHTTLIIRDLPVLEAIPLQMSQLFGNLLGNAIKFRRKDIQPVITVSSAPLSAAEKKKFRLPHNRKFFKLSVKDNGIGFEAAYSTKIFQLFQRMHGKTEYPGSGIGLAICKKIVDYHQGVIFAESDGETGATFIIILPERQEERIPDHL
ncbi:hypothetical protein GCM10023143_15260 [Compostibacter hankyongensis]|uniref:histidine kinase n=2 Tax=Compostibacter hankyongensis TaxID=1007089 RepID=A0ABP8FP31_9BACT